MGRKHHKHHQHRKRKALFTPFRVALFVVLGLIVFSVYSSVANLGLAKEPTPSESTAGSSNFRVDVGDPEVSGGHLYSSLLVDPQRVDSLSPGGWGDARSAVEVDKNSFLRGSEEAVPVSSEKPASNYSSSVVPVVVDGLAVESGSSEKGGVNGAESSSFQENVTSTVVTEAPAEDNPVEAAATVCLALQREHGVLPSVSWGSLTSSDQDRWNSLNCDVHVMAAVESPPTAVATAEAATAEVAPPVGAAAATEAKVVSAANGAEDAECAQMKAEHRVVPGSTWGTLSSAGQRRWSDLSCDLQPSVGGTTGGPCDIWAASYVEDWRQRVGPACESSDPDGSHVQCYKAGTGSNVCVLRNVAVDFARAAVNGKARSLGSGLITGKCSPSGFDKSNDALRTFQTASEAVGSAGAGACSRWEEQTSVFISHDDIGNTYHSLGDFWRIWLALEVAAEPLGFGLGGVGALQAPLPAQLVNMDARLMCGGSDVNGNKLAAPLPDCEGIYFDQYRRWFSGGVVRAADYGSDRVCFRTLAFAYDGGPNHIWEDFWKTNRCSLSGPSELVQAYSRFNMQAWGTWPAMAGAGEGDQDLASVGPPIDAAAAVRLVLLLRNKKPFTTAPIRNRVIANREELFAALDAVEGLKWQALDFATLSFTEQLRIMADTHVLLGMHGAGMVHELHMPWARSRTAVVELFPHKHEEKGVGNLARHVGSRYLSWTNVDASREVSGGTRVDVDAVRRLVEQAASYVRGLVE